MSLLLLIAAAWIAIGAVAVAVMHSRGHDIFSWALLFVVLGPLALPLALSSDRHPPTQPAWRDRNGGLDVLVAHDGTVATSATLDAALELLAERVTSVTLAAVVDAEAATTVRGQGTQRQAQARLDDAVRDTQTRTAAPVDAVVLFGEPCHAVGAFASTHGYEIIIGSARIARHAPVPVLVAPAAR